MHRLLVDSILVNVKVVLETKLQIHLALVTIIFHNGTHHFPVSMVRVVMVIMELMHMDCHLVVVVSVGMPVQEIFVVKMVPRLVVVMLLVEAEVVVYVVDAEVVGMVVVEIE